MILGCSLTSTTHMTYVCFRTLFGTTILTLPTNLSSDDYFEVVSKKGWSFTRGGWSIMLST